MRGIVFHHLRNRESRSWIEFKQLRGADFIHCASEGGNPDAADAPRTIRGMAILFKLSDGEEWRTAMTNIPVFTAKSAQAFHD